MFFRKAKARNRTYSVRDRPGAFILASDEAPPVGTELDVLYRGVPYRSWYVAGVGVYLTEFDEKYISDLTQIKWFKHSIK